MTLESLWARYQLGAVLAGRRSAFPIQGGPEEYPYILNVCRMFRRPISLERVAFYVDLHHGLDVFDELHSAVAYRNDVLRRVRALGPYEVLHRAFVEDEANRLAAEKVLLDAIESRERITSRQTALFAEMRKAS